jgi:hypothetical protein
LHSSGDMTNVCVVTLAPVVGNVVIVQRTEHISSSNSCGAETVRPHPWE